MTRFSRSVRYRDDDPVVRLMSEDHLIGKVPHQIESVPFITAWETLRIRSDRPQRMIQFSVEAFCSWDATLGIPRQRLRAIFFGGRTDDKVNHRVQLCDERAGELLATLKRSSAQRRKPHCAAELRRSSLRQAVPSRQVKCCPRARVSTDRARRMRAPVPHRESLELCSYLYLSRVSRRIVGRNALRDRVSLTPANRGLQG